MSGGRLSFGRIWASGAHELAEPQADFPVTNYLQFQGPDNIRKHRVLRGLTSFVNTQSRTQRQITSAQHVFSLRRWASSAELRREDRGSRARS
jgi:hypothetical protein